MRVDHDEFLPTRQSLLSRLKDWDDRDSWFDFFNTYWRLIYKAALRSALSETEAQEVVQATVIAVSKKMPGFTYDPDVDSFKGWLLYLTRKNISKAYLKRRQERGGQGGRPEILPLPEGIEGLPDPVGSDLEAIWESEWEENLMNAALARVKQKVEPKQYQAFNYYVLKEWPVKEVAETLGVKVPWIYLTKHRVSKLLKQELARLNQGMS